MAKNMHHVMLKWIKVAGSGDLCLHAFDSCNIHLERVTPKPEGHLRVVAAIWFYELEFLMGLTYADLDRVNLQ